MLTVEEFCLIPKRFEWGTCDCYLMCCDWILAAVGKDPGAPYRGTYHSADEAAALIASHGGPASFADHCMKAVGFGKTKKPRDGDIGIVRQLPGVSVGEEFKEFPAIRFGPLWAVMSVRGPMIKKLDWTGAAWRVA